MEWSSHMQTLGPGLGASPPAAVSPPYFSVGKGDPRRYTSSPNGESGLGDGTWGMGIGHGHGVWGMGHGTWGLGHRTWDN